MLSPSKMISNLEEPAEDGHSTKKKLTKQNKIPMPLKTIFFLKKKQFKK